MYRLGHQQTLQCCPAAQPPGIGWTLTTITSIEHGLIAAWRFVAVSTSPLRMAHDSVAGNIPFNVSIPSGLRRLVTLPERLGKCEPGSLRLQIGLCPL